MMSGEIESNQIKSTVSVLHQYMYAPLFLVADSSGEMHEMSCLFIDEFMIPR